MTPEGMHGRKKMTALIRRTTIFYDGPSKSLGDAVFTTVGWVDWYSHRLLHGSFGMVSPDAYGVAHYAARKPVPLPAWT